jgi:hypothetical protein
MDAAIAAVDDIVARGSEDKIRDRINAHLKAGATHVRICQSTSG